MSLRRLLLLASSLVLLFGLGSCAFPPQTASVKIDYNIPSLKVKDVKVNGKAATGTAKEDGISGLRFKAKVGDTVKITATPVTPYGNVTELTWEEKVYDGMESFLILSPPQGTFVVDGLVSNHWADDTGSSYNYVEIYSQSDTTAVTFQCGTASFAMAGSDAVKDYMVVISEGDQGTLGRVCFGVFAYLPGIPATASRTTWTTSNGLGVNVWRYTPDPQKSTTTTTPAAEPTNGGTFTIN